MGHDSNFLFLYYLRFYGGNSTADTNTYVLDILPIVGGILVIWAASRRPWVDWRDSRLALTTANASSGISKTLR